MKRNQNYLKQKKLYKAFVWFYLYCMMSITFLNAQSIDPSSETVASFYQQLNKLNTDARKRQQSTYAVNLKISNTKELLIDDLQRSEKGTSVVYTGKVKDDNRSQVYFNFDGDQLEGKVVIPSSNVAYIYSADDEKSIKVTYTQADKVMCVEYEKVKSNKREEVAAVPPPNSYAYTLQSLPGAQAVVMLDFDGHDATGSWWGNIIAAPGVATEQDIIETFQIMREDFSSLQLNITTNEAVYQAAPVNLRMRCIFTTTTDAYPGSGGVAYIGSFNNGGELAPCWVFNYGNGKVMGETGSHEIGHTLGLYHDGRNLPDGSYETYFGGHGDWAPIMGVSFSPLITQWSIGEYQYANNTSQDDIAIMASSQYRVGFRSDFHGNTIGTSGILNYTSTGFVSAGVNKGEIADRADADYYAFVTNGGTTNFVINNASAFPDLDLQVSLQTASGNTLAYSNPPGIGACVISYNLAPGTYYLKVDGVGYRNPFSDGYSDYSSIGEYTIVGQVSNPVPLYPPTVSITSPYDGAVFTPLSSVVVSANASDQDGSINRVDFYENDVLVFSDFTAPYTYNFSTPTEGDYKLVAVAIDNSGLSGTSTPVRIRVFQPYGISGPNCVLSGQTNSFTLKPSYSNYQNISWWVNGDASIQQNPSNPTQVNVTMSQWNGASVTLVAGVTYTTHPWYRQYQKQVFVNNCTPSASASSNQDVSIIDVPMNVRIFDLNGVELAKGKTDKPHQYLQEQSLPFGLYLIQVYDENSSYMIKAIKQ